MFKPCFPLLLESHHVAFRNGRSYNAAITALNTLQSNFATVERIRKHGRDMNELSIPEMNQWCRQIGYEPSDFNQLNLIHVAGTKGKGSTSAFISSILSQYVSPSGSPAPNGPFKGLHKIGLFTSPHLRFVRERIQINNQPLSEAAFAKYFFDVWDRLEAAHVSPKPMYFRFLTLVALHAYMSEGVDTAILEVGIGGEYDSTNLITAPKTTAITSLGIDHTALLGATLPEIAWHKAGIFKPSAPAFTSPQPAAAMTVLRSRAHERNTTLHVVPPHPDLARLPLGLSGAFQATNASLAIAAAASHLRSLGHHTSSSTSPIPDPTLTPSIPLPAAFRAGLAAVRFPGRCDVRREPGLAWHVDGAHTAESIAAAAAWFAAEVAAARRRQRGGREPALALVFNQQQRDPGALARGLFEALARPAAGEGEEAVRFAKVVFTTNVPFERSTREGEEGGKGNLNFVSAATDVRAVETLSVQRGLAEMWKELDPGCEVRVTRTVEEAVAEARGLVGGEEEVMVLVTGSLHLVGSFLEVIESTTES